MKLDDDANLTTEMGGWEEAEGDKNCRLGTFYPTADGKGFLRMKMKFDARSFFSARYPTDDTSISAGVSTNPSEEAFFLLANQRADKTAVGVSGYGAGWVSDWRITYVVKFQEPKDAGSLSVTPFQQ